MFCSGHPLCQPDSGALGITRLRHIDEFAARIPAIAPHVPRGQHNFTHRRYDYAFDQGCFQITRTRDHVHVQVERVFHRETLSTARLKARIPEALPTWTLVSFFTQSSRQATCARQLGSALLASNCPRTWTAVGAQVVLEDVLPISSSCSCGLRSARRLGITLSREWRLMSRMRPSLPIFAKCSLSAHLFSGLRACLAAFLTRYMTIFVVARSEFVANVFEEHPLDSTEEFMLPKMHIFFAPLLSIVSLMLFYEENELGQVRHSQCPCAFLSQ